ncbi:BTAD domain-containing putative transcriptional regulator [Kibdelosporangium lantanae]
MAVAFRLLGELRVSRDNRPVPIQYPRQRTLLAALLVDLNTVVPTDVLTERVWGTDLPDAPRAALHTYLSRVRKSVGPGVEITQRSGGYLLAADPATVDLHRFRRLVADARGRADDEAATALTDALAEWDGDAFTGMDGPWVTDLRAALDQERLLARMDLYDIRLRQRRHEELLPELRDLAATHPLDERLAAQLILALHRSGQRGEALERYRQVRTRLADELGMDPGETLREAYREINRVVPRQLPAAVATFTGRTDYLDQLDHLLPGNTVVISALSGMGGIGKTTLAVHWAHRVAGHFPDGQLYLDLRGFDSTGAVMTPGEAIRIMLDGLGVPPRSVPVDLTAQIELFRELVATRRLLVVLDNARDADQVRPLLPDAPGCLVVVTSRNHLGDLAAHTLTLDLLSRAEAGQLLAERLGRERVDAEPAAVDEIIARCAQLPLALAVTAAHAAIRATVPLSSIAVELGDDINAVFSWSYRALDDRTKRAFRLLAIHPAADFHLDAAASLVGVPVDEAKALVDELVQASLLTEYLPGRYRFHDLVRAYARTEPSTVEETAAARLRLLDHYLHSAWIMGLRLRPSRTAIEMADPSPGAVLVKASTLPAMLGWFEAEHRCLVTATQYAFDLGYWTHTWQLAWSMVDFLARQGLRDDQMRVQQLALDAANRSADVVGRAFALRGLGRAATRLGAYEDAYRYFDAALAARVELGHLHEQAIVHLEFTVTLLLEGRPAEALRHAEMALRLDVRSGHEQGQSKALSGMGYCHALLGNYREALTCCQRSLDMFDDALGASTSKADTLDTIGYVYHHLGDHAQAVAYYQRCLVLGQESQDIMTQGTALARIGDVHWDAGELAEARQAWQDALAVLGDVNPPDSVQLRAKLARPDR